MAKTILRNARRSETTIATSAAIEEAETAVGERTGRLSVDETMIRTRAIEIEIETGIEIEREIVEETVSEETVSEEIAIETMTSVAVTRIDRAAAGEKIRETATGKEETRTETMTQIENTKAADMTDASRFRKTFSWNSNENQGLRRHARRFPIIAASCEELILLLLARSWRSYDRFIIRLVGLFMHRIKDLVQFSPSFLVSCLLDSFLNNIPYHSI